jgi:hypothetical protein
VGWVGENSCYAGSLERQRELHSQLRDCQWERVYRVRTSSNQYRKTRGRHGEVESSVLGAFRVFNCPSDRANTNVEVCIVRKGLSFDVVELIRTIASSTIVPLRGRLRGRQLPTSWLCGS